MRVYGSERSGESFKDTSDDCIEVVMEKGNSLNKVFAELDQSGFQVRSMRTKANRLEELFVSLVQQHQHKQEGK